MRNHKKSFGVARKQEEEREKRQTEKESASFRRREPAYSFFGCKTGRTVREKKERPEDLIVEIAMESSPETHKTHSDDKRIRLENKR